MDQSLARTGLLRGNASMITLDHVVHSFGQSEIELEEICYLGEMSLLCRSVCVKDECFDCFVIKVYSDADVSL